MRILFAISVLSFFLLLCAAVAVARHVRRSKAQGSMPIEPDILDSISRTTEANVPSAPELVGVASSHQPTHRIRYASVERRDQQN